MTMKTLAVLALLSCFPFFASGDEPAKLLPRCGHTDFGLCGYIDATIWEEEGRTQFIVEPVFEDAERFSEGLAIVRIEGKYGYIDPAGKVVIAPLTKLFHTEK